ncbi:MULTISPECIES: IPT/TIG domain-containing protein [unclassified Sphingobacterium]|uniref:IPT/TIG domain-containing protein n=1 Tax=unclassified Sphingobacterium TaxID=2609468 RepID=UPI0025FDB96B|nr:MULTISPECIES: IPT/TIG domain-containing protein [unclassified Sphingobacterium]
MKKTRSIYIVAFFLLWLSISSLSILVGCKKKEVIEPVDYSPIQLETTTFSDLEDKTVTLNGHIARLNGMPVEDYGFLIQKVTTTNGEKETVVSLGKKATVGNVTLKYQHNSNFELGDRYRYTLYVKTKNGFYRGEPNTFEVDGIKINLLEDKLVPNNNKVTVTGDFQFLSENIKLYYQSQNQGEHVIPYQVGSDRKSLSFIFPKSDNFYHGNKVSVFLRVKDQSGYASNRTIANIEVLGVANPPVKTKFYLNEPIPITGNAIKWDGMPMSAPFYMLINGKKVECYHQVNLYEIESLKGGKFQLGFHNGKDSVIFKDSIELIRPLGSNIHFTKKVIHSPSLMKIDGIDMYTYLMNPEKASYYLGKHSIAHFFDSSTGSIETFTVRDVPDGVYTFGYSSPYYSVSSTERVEVRTLKWNTPADLTKFVGEPFTITGNFIEGQTYSVIGNGIYEYPVAQDGKIQFALPGYIIGSTEIQIGYSVNYNYNENYYSPQKQQLYIRNFEVTSISPLKGYPGDVVTIKGRGLSQINVTIGGAYATSVFRSSEELRFIVPAFASRGKSEVIMTMHDKTMKYKDLFEVL